MKVCRPCLVAAACLVLVVGAHAQQLTLPPPNYPAPVPHPRSQQMSDERVRGLEDEAYDLWGPVRHEGVQQLDRDLAAARREFSKPEAQALFDQVQAYREALALGEYDDAYSKDFDQIRYVLRGWRPWSSPTFYPKAMTRIRNRAARLQAELDVVRAGIELAKREAVALGLTPFEREVLRLRDEVTRLEQAISSTPAAGDLATHVAPWAAALRALHRLEAEAR